MNTTRSLARAVTVPFLATTICFLSLAETRSQSSPTNGSATSGTVTGGTATGGSATGGSVTAGSAVGGSATGGSATGGSVTTSAGGGHVTNGTVTPGTATARVAGREISASGAGSVSVHSEGDEAQVHLDGHVLTVEKERLLVDGKPRAKLPPSAEKIQINLTAGRLTVRADGAQVLSENFESK